MYSAPTNITISGFSNMHEYNSWYTKNMKYIPITLSSIAIILSACPKNPSEGTSTNSTTSELTSTSNNSIPTSNGIETSNGPTSENETSISESTLTSNNSTSTDSSTTLTTSTSFSTTSTSSTSDTGNIEFCGNAIVEGIEQCDDGNIEDIDLCDNNCQKSRFIFLSSDYIGGSGGFGGIEKADAFCQKDATLFKLPGTYKAWLNDCKNTLISRLASENFVSWYLLPKLNDSKYIEVAKGWFELTSGILKNPIDTIGNGNKPFEASMVWTNTLIDGNVYGNDTCCFDWFVKDPSIKGHVGLSSSTMSQWTNVGPMACDKGAKLYCIQVTD